LVAKNNYFWCRPSVVGQGGVEPTGAARAMDFIANGDTAIVEAIHSTEEREGVTFADARLFFPDHNARVDARLLLDALTAESPGASRETLDRLVAIAFADAGVTAASSVTAQRKALKESPYFNALQVKYAYAVTCHKAQGGQWRSVFVDMGYIPPEAYRTEDFYRWLYTAVTRATEQLWLINPSVTID
ncbi:MAG: ATP-binding domain-containing protein, partial [Muribaculaceae bacterium]|nr:ATP-binding domain-containing protein [Muribaculaceae bacterium]